MNSYWLTSNLEILPQLLVNSLITGSIYAIASSGLALTFGVTKVLNFAHGHWMMLGAYVFYAFFSQDMLGAHFGFWGASATSILVLLCLGYISQKIFIRPFFNLDPLLPFVSTLALAAILESSVSLIYGVNVLSFDVGLLGQSLTIGELFITPWQIIIIVSSVIILALLGVYIHMTRYGRSLLGLSENFHSAESIGINSKNHLLVSYLIGIMLAGIAGILVAFETNLQPTMGHSYTIKAFAAMILGGMGNIWGTVIGAMILGLIENLSIGLDLGGYSLPTGYKDAFAFLVILLTLLIRPQGILGNKSRKV